MTVKSARILKSAKIIDARSDEYANERIASMKSGARAKRIAHVLLRHGWLEGYAAAMNDAVAIREAANEVKH